MWRILETPHKILVWQGEINMKSDSQVCYGGPATSTSFDRKRSGIATITWRKTNMLIIAKNKTRDPTTNQPIVVMRDADGSGTKRCWISVPCVHTLSMLWTIHIVAFSMCRSLVMMKLQKIVLKWASHLQLQMRSKAFWFFSDITNKLPSSV